MPGFKFPHVHTHLVILLDMYIVVLRLLVYTYVFKRRGYIIFQADRFPPDYEACEKVHIRYIRKNTQFLIAWLLSHQANAPPHAHEPSANG